MVILCSIDLFVERIFLFRHVLTATCIHKELWCSCLNQIETSEDCAKVSTSEERQSFVENLDQAQIKNMQADKDIEKIAMVLRCPSLFVSKAL
ncbi:uncharacterized protein G2W53_026312 [Senna tora]|uniref:Uncharacterized protein n=1 Tax=Senna tora TaxID=362788 RepID=A0A834TEU9_9FABA|nr:uncharacterized protein G2W53_026312 [Senna tora]